MRTVLRVDPFGSIDMDTGAQALILKVDSCPFDIKEAKVFQTFKLSPKDLPPLRSQNGVIEHGRRMKAALDQHPGVKSVLAQLLTVGPGQIRPIFIKLDRGDAELLTWETLCDANDKFVALDRRWPIGRISVPTNPRPPATFREPVRIMVFVSALGITKQVKEWNFIYDAARDARDAGLNINLRLMCADAETRTAADQLVANGNNWIEVSPIASTPQRVLQDIGKWAPNILHFFCHGISRENGQFIELATASDYLDDQAKGGSVRIPAELLSDLAGQLPNPWLLALNCCSGGHAAGELQSIAHQVVGAGFPAAVAMLEPVDAADAHEFARSFYNSLFAKLDGVRKELAKKSVRVPFEWGEPLYDARLAISGLHEAGPKSSPEWALPVLYVGGVEPMHFERARDEDVGAAAEFKFRAKLVAEWLAVIKSTMPSDKRESAMKEALNDVPKEYWPTADGVFTNG